MNGTNLLCISSTLLASVYLGAHGHRLRRPAFRCSILEIAHRICRDHFLNPRLSAGANTAISSVVDGSFLRTFRCKHQQRPSDFNETAAKIGLQAGPQQGDRPNPPFSPEGL